ncbi:hypothetical protein SAMN04489733_1731 [Amycolatopsis keratiniphila]|nr:hypothetical protein SAMN04489733_1731 [Amycolatopsis keratiniphila]
MKASFPTFKVGKEAFTDYAIAIRSLSNSNSNSSGCA